MITVHHLNDSRSQRVLWLLEELEIAYEVRHYQRNPATMLAPPELKSLHPLGKAPLITDDAITVIESGAIVEYLVERYGGGRLCPAIGTPERLRYQQWLHFAEGSMQAMLVLKLFFNRIPNGPMPEEARSVVQRIRDEVSASYIDVNLQAQLDFVEAELGRSEWLAGDAFTAADVHMGFPLEVAAERVGIDDTRPRILAFLDRIHARPAYRMALARGGPYKFAK